MTRLLITTATNSLANLYWNLDSFSEKPASPKGQLRQGCVTVDSRP